MLFGESTRSVVGESYEETSLFFFFWQKRNVFLEFQLGGTISRVSIASPVLRTAIRVIMGDGNFQQARMREVPNTHLCTTITKQINPLYSVNIGLHYGSLLFQPN